MAPSVDTQVENATSQLSETSSLVQKISLSGYIREPLKYSGSLEEYESSDVTTAIGREYPNVQLSSILDDERKIRDLAITG
jgi:hypothetical protein